MTWRVLLKKILDKQVEVYCDGACKGNGNHGDGGWGVYIRVTHNWLQDGKQDVFEYELCGGEEDTTNNKMELTALIEAARWIVLNHYGKEKVTFYIDSAYIVNCYQQEWWRKWLNNGWLNSKKEPVANKELWEKVIVIFQQPTFHFVKVKGHSNNKGNEKADLLANQGIPLPFIKRNPFQVIVVNGKPRSGKDTFSNALIKEGRINNKQILLWSTVDVYKRVLEDVLGRPYNPNESKDRYLLSQLKFLFNSTYNVTLSSFIGLTKESRDGIIIHSREKEEIENIKEICERCGFGFTYVFMEGKYQQEYANESDANVDNFFPDTSITISNNGTLAELEENARKVYKELF